MRVNTVLGVICAVVLVFTTVLETSVHAVELNWNSLDVPGDKPQSRSWPSAIYDPLGHQMVLFGGWSSVPYNSMNDTWVFDLDTNTWMRLFPTGGPPPNRAGHVAVYDSARHRMVVFGGSNWWTTWYNDTWALDLSTNHWVQLSTSSPPSRRIQACAVYDVQGDDLVVFGGNDGSGALDELWVLDLGSQQWSRVYPSGSPPGRRAIATAVLDPQTNHMLVFGGWGDTLCSSPWALDLDAYSGVGLQDLGEDRTDHGAAFVLAKRCMVTVAGWGSAPESGDVLVFDVDTNAWLPVTFHDEEPIARGNPAVTYDPVGNRVVMFGGGLSLTADYNDTWELVFDALSPHYRITSIADVGNDQGRRVRIRWNRCPQDEAGSGTPITQYSIWRRVDGDRGERRQAVCPPDATDLVYPPGDWDFVVTMPAMGEDVYGTVCETLCDSTVNGMCWSIFFVRAHTAQPTVFFDTLPDSGYSVDNIAPTAPTGLRRDIGNMLVWDGSSDFDFHYFTVYGSAVDHLNGSELLIDHTTGTSLSIAGLTHAYFLVTATDCNGNEGLAATLDALTGVPSTQPRQYALHPCAPNPFNPMTTIQFDLPQPCRVSVRVYDIAGRLVQTLVDREEMNAGRQRVVWRGCDESGRPLAAGSYFCRLEAGSYSATRRMALVK